MRPNRANNTRSQSGKNDHQKKSVFDRLGHQVDSKRRPSPYGRFGPPSRTPQSSGMGISDNGARQRGQFMARNNMPQQHEQADWRQGGDRERHQNFMDRHRLPQQQQLGPPGPLGPQQQQFQYGLDMPNNRHGPFFLPQDDNYGQGMNGPPQAGPPMGHLDMPPFHHRPNPKFDAHANSPMQFRDRRMDYCSPPMEMNFMHMPDESGHMYMQGPPNMDMNAPPDMIPNNGDRGNFMGPPQHGPPPLMPRWNPNLDSDMIPMHHMNQGGRLLMDQQGMCRPMPDGHMILDESQQMNSVNANIEQHTGRYTKWRERRDVITNLDRETARSSFRTDSLKSSLHHNVGVNRNDLYAGPSRSSDDSKNLPDKSMLNRTNDKSKVRSRRRGRRRKQPLPKKSVEPQDMSDGEILEEESVSEEEVLDDNGSEDSNKLIETEIIDRENVPKRSRTSYEDRDKDEPDYETISDDDLDEIMKDGQKKSIRKHSSKKNDPDKEMLIALGLDWGSLVEMAKQNKNTARYKITSERSGALSRFKLSEYLPKLGICKDLINPDLQQIVDKICKSREC